MSWEKITFIAIVFLQITCFNAYGHRLNVFAWLDNDKITVQCNFGKNRPAIDAKVDVRDNISHTSILEGKTNKEGIFSFEAPDVIRQGHNLQIIVDGGEGHRGEWIMEASELYAAASLKAGFDSAMLKDKANKSSDMSQIQENLELPASSSLTETQIRAIIQESISPLHNQIAKLVNKGPGIVEIIGGIGWILGLAGIAFYFMAKNKKQ